LVAAVAAGSVCADPGSTTEAVSYIDQTNVVERFRYLERLDVTAEKPAAAADQVEPVSAEVDDILAEAQVLE